jgi:hypothetical protein
VDLRSKLDLTRGFSGWGALWRRLNPFARPLDVPYISSVLMRSAVVASILRERERRAAERVSLYLKLPVEKWGLLEFDQLEPIAACGYETCAPRVGEWWAARRNGASP